MPPRLPLQQCLSRALKRKPVEPFVCPRCSLWCATKPRQRPTFAIRDRELVRSSTSTTCKATIAASYEHTSRRRASTLASATSINAPLNVPQRHKELYFALDRLKTDAASYVNLSRIQLALSSLKSEEPAIRIAVLSLDASGRANVRQLVRLLLADPLSPSAPWEKELESLSEEDGRGLLIRYGEEGAIPPSNQLIRTLLAPSRFLQKHNLEILISGLNIGSLDSVSPIPRIAEAPTDAVLVPMLQTDITSAGRGTMVRYPVHRAIVFADGVEQCVAYGRYTASAGPQDVPEDMVKVVLGLPGSEAKEEDSAYAVVDVQTGSKAVAKFRESIQNSVAYEQGWFKSGMPSLTSWLAPSTPSNRTIHPDVKNLISSLTISTEKAIITAETTSLADKVSTAIPGSTRAELLEAASTWAEHSHTELRDSFNVAFSSALWGKLKWYKLLWRTDDIPAITSTILNRFFLVDAEKGIIHLSGRMAQAGFYQDLPAGYPFLPSEGAEEQMPGRMPRFVGKTGLAADFEKQVFFGGSLGEKVIKEERRKQSVESTLPAPQLRPWPMDIPLTRTMLYNATIPALQARAQSLFLQSLSTATLTSGLAALAYVGVTGAGLYEAGAVAAVGIVWSLRRLQVKWEEEREGWEQRVREEGRTALKATEERVRWDVQSLRRGEVDDDGAEERKTARKVVEDVKECLERAEPV